MEDAIGKNKMKKMLYKIYQYVVKLLWGSGLGRIQPIYWVYSGLFQLLRPDEQIMEIGGSKMISSMSDLPISFNRTFQAYMVKEGWEVETTRLFKSMAKEGDTIVDIGANIGYYTLLSSRIVGDKGKVYAFEPDPTNYSILTKNIALNKYTNIETVQKAVSDKNEKLKLYLNDSDVGAHTIYHSNISKKFVEVDSVRLDDYFKGKEIPINIIKMDIEGAEMAALSGMTNIIKMNKGLKIFAEFHIPWIKRAGVSPDYFISQLLEHYKFSITVIHDYTRHIKSERINTKEELLNICMDDKVVNLLLEVNN